MSKGILVSIFVLAFTGCADVCAKGDECAKKAGRSFSITECRTEATANRERANTKGCAAEYGAAEACFAGLTCDQLASLDGIAANCGAPFEKLNKCTQ